MIDAFEDFELDRGTFELRRSGTVVPVEPQVFDVLAYLIAHRERVVPKEELLQQVWGTTFVTESTLTSRIKAARQAVGDDGQAQRLIRTAHGRGYRFVGEVRPGGPPVEVPLATAPPPVEQKIRFCRTPDGVQLAYAEVGTGPPLVKASNWLSHLDYEWQSPVWRHWMRGLSRHHRLIRYDERGCGLSDWDAEHISLNTYVNDLLTVVDAAGLERFPLVGISRGGPVALAFAAGHPERVSRLVLYGAFAKGRLAAARTETERREAELMRELAEVGWGQEDPAFRRVFTMQFMPEGTPELWAAFDELQRRTSSPANAARIMAIAGTIDVTDIAPEVRAPTLVLHARGDRRVPFERGRQLAGLIPGSRFVPLDSVNHILLEREPAWQRFLDEVEPFLSEGADE